jgi:hypothetical protein
MHPRISGVAQGLFEDHAGTEVGRILMHGGNMEGFATDMVLFPELGQGWFVANHIESSRLRQRVRDVLLDRFYRRPAVAPIPAVRPSRATDYAGAYGWNTYCHTCPGGAPYSRITLESERDGILRMNDRRWVETGPGFFVREDGKDSLAIIRDPSGQVTHLHWGAWAVFERLRP